MQINLSKFVGLLTGIAAAGAIGFFCYFMYLLFFVGPVPDGVAMNATIDTTIFADNIQKAAAITKNKNIFLGKTNITFTDSALFKSFSEVPEPVPLTDTRGRDDPFVPYVAP